MRKNKLGIASGIISIIISIMIILAGVGLIVLSIKDYGGLWTKYALKDTTTTVDDERVGTESDESNGEVLENTVDESEATKNTVVEKEKGIVLLDKSYDFAKECISKIPTKYQPFVGSGITILGIILLVIGLSSLKRRAKGLFIVRAIIGTLIFLVLTAGLIYLVIQGLPLVTLLFSIGGVAVYTVTFPLMTWLAYANKIKIGKRKPTIINGTSYNSKKDKKKKMNTVKLKNTNRKQKAIGTSGKVLATPMAKPIAAKASELPVRKDAKLVKKRKSKSTTKSKAQKK